MPSPSPLAPAALPALPPIHGVQLATSNTGIRYQGRPDLLLASFSPGTHVAGVLTRSLCTSASVDACRVSLQGGVARALVVNAGNANAFTGKAGMDSVIRIMQSAAALEACAASEVFTASTGVIGVPLPDEKITAALPDMRTVLAEQAWESAAHAIMTTDTFPKCATRSAMIGDTQITLNGIAKGSGMIAPDMATMLAFIATDAAIPAPVLQSMLNEANSQSFNCITVDGDTSTSDTCLLFATGTAHHPLIASAETSLLADFRQALTSLMIELAQLIVRDGEGAAKFIDITVTGAAHDAAARRIALSIANSPLVKTAIAGEDANWGRIVAAVGKAGERADRDRLRVTIGGVVVARDGAIDPDYREAAIIPHMKGREITISVDVGIAQGRATVWTCDLTHGYIDINGSYRS